MPNPRPSAWALIGVLLATLFAVSAAPVAAKPVEPSATPQVANPNNVCGTTVTNTDGSKVFTPGLMPTGWTDDQHPPTTIRVRRTSGPDNGHVETVNFWWYVAVVMRAEYSTGLNKPPLWMQVGSIVVKQYGWFKAMTWSGGRVTTTTTDPETGVITATSECYDVWDNTNDQIYKPPQLDGSGNCIDGTGNCPTTNIYNAMAQTWQITMRKWNATKNVSNLFLSGYRSGGNKACGNDSTGFKVYQQSFHDCTTKNLTLEEALREYFEPMLLVNTRDHDTLSDGSWYGDLPVLSAGSGNTSWSLYAGKPDGFASAVSGTFSLSYSSIVGYDTGNVELPSANPTATDKNMLADMVMATNSAVYVAPATGNSNNAFGSLVQTNFSGGASKVVFGDFNGDLLMDVGLVRGNGDGTTSLWVMTAKGDDTFNSPVQMWTGSVDLTPSTVFVAAGDVNGDGKADLIYRDSNGDFYTAVSPASCAEPYTTVGVCPTANVGTFTLGSPTLALANPGGLSNAKFTVGDYDRDGRADIIALVTGSTNTVYGMRAKTDNSGTFTAMSSLWSSSSLNLSGAQPFAMDVDPDGMADLALVQSGNMQWLRTIERSSTPAEMVLSSQFPYEGKDTTPPSVPTGLTGSASSGRTISLSWHASTDNSGGTVTYRVYRDGSPIGTAQTDLSFVDHPTKVGNHSYIVRAFDGAGNRSGPSNQVTLKAIN